MEPDLILPCELSVDEQRRDEQRFNRRMVRELEKRLRPLGFIRVVYGGSSAKYWDCLANMGDGTPVRVRVRVEELTKLDPMNDQGMTEGFIACCANYVSSKLFAEAERIRKPPEPVDHVKHGVIRGDGFVRIELGGELAKIMGDAAYELDAEMAGEKEPDDPTRATNLNPASSTPKDSPRV